jgi:GTP cyclohydrolase II
MHVRRDVFDTPLFGTPDQVGLVRGVTEIRARRPVLVTANSETVLALPIDGIDSSRLTVFRQLCSPHSPKLILSAPRVRWLGFQTSVPMAFTVTARTSVKRLLELAVDSEVDHAPDAEPAGVAAVAALQLAKLAQSLPAVLASRAYRAVTAIFDPPLMTIEASAVRHCRKDIVRSLRMVGKASIPLSIGTQARFVAFCDALGENSVAIIVGNPDLTKPVRVRLHSACLTGDVFGSRRCDCGDQLKLSLARLGETGGGVILYLAQEGRGLGLGNKLRTYQLQEAGLDTVDANAALGFDDDERDYGVAARILQMLRIQRIVLLTNNPTKLDGLARSGIEITGCLPVQAPVNSDNARYLAAKAARAGHRLDHLIGSLAESIDCNAIRTDRTAVTERPAHSATLAETMPHGRKSATTTS